MYLNFFKLWVYGVLTFLVITLWGTETGLDLIIQWTVAVFILDFFILDLKWEKIAKDLYYRITKKPKFDKEKEVKITHCKYCDQIKVERYQLDEKIEYTLDG